MAANDLHLPAAQIKRVVCSKLPPGSDEKNVSLSKDAQLAFSEAAKVFISYVSARLRFPICLMHAPLSESMLPRSMIPWATMLRSPWTHIPHILIPPNIPFLNLFTHAHLQVSSAANDICKDGKRQTISSDDVIKAVEELEFSELVPQLKEYLEGR